MDINKNQRSSRDHLREHQDRKGKGASIARAELAALKEALKKRVSQLTILYQMGKDISENENWSEALDRFLMALVKYMNAEGAAMLLFSQNCTMLSWRANFQVDEAVLNESCKVLLEGWDKHPRLLEIHSLEGYTDKRPSTCLERFQPWRITIIPLKHRNRALGFLLLDKVYRQNKDFEIDFQFLNTIQTIFTEQVANAAYISELRSLSRFNQKVLKTINSGVITTDREGSVSFFNHRASALCQQLQESKKIHFNDIFRSEAFGGNFFERIINSSKDNHILEVEAFNAKGASFPTKLSTSKMFDDKLNGEVIVAIFEDLTEQKLMEKEIRKNDRLRTLGQLSAGVAHEIRNPLTGIATSVEVLESKLKGQDEKVKYIKAVLDEISRLDGIIKNLLDFARPAKPSLRDCALSDVASRVFNLLEDHARKKGIKLRSINKLKFDICKADADQLTQVLLNVVLNAIQVCGEGDEVKVIIDQEYDEQKQHYARIEVIDTGPGIPEEIRENLFEPFVTTKTRGTGMGLAISHQIIEEHNGQITCAFPSKGAKFTILLPMECSKETLNPEDGSERYVENHTDHR